MGSEEVPATDAAPGSTTAAEAAKSDPAPAPAPTPKPAPAPTPKPAPTPAKGTQKGKFMNMARTLAGIQKKIKMEREKLNELKKNKRQGRPTTSKSKSRSPGGSRSNSRSRSNSPPSERSRNSNSSRGRKTRSRSGSRSPTRPSSRGVSGASGASGGAIGKPPAPQGGPGGNRPKSKRSPRRAPSPLPPGANSSQMGIANEQLDEGLEEAEAAATTIQTRFRGNQVRKKKGLKTRTPTWKKKRQMVIDDLTKLRSDLQNFSEDLKYKVDPEALGMLLEEIHFTRLELEKLVEDYKTATAQSHTGYIFLSDFRKYIRGMFPPQKPPPQELVDALFKLFDTNDDEKLDFLEFARGLNTVLKGTVQQKIDFLWHLYDQDGDGNISLEELSKLLERGIGTKMCLAKFVKHSLTGIDTDGDSRISKAEFLAAVEKDSSVLQAFAQILPPSALHVNKEASEELFKVATELEFNWDEIREKWRLYATGRGSTGHSTVDRDQFKFLLQSIFHLRDGGVINRCFDKFDLNKDGLVDFLEFVTGLTPLMGSVEEKVEFYFTLFDDDGNGCFDRTELYQVLNTSKRRDVKEICSETKRILESVSGGNQKITLDEYKEACVKDPTLLECFAEVFR